MSDADLERLVKDGNYAEMWKIDLNQGRIRAARLLSHIEWRQDAEIVSSVDISDGRWSVVIKRPIRTQAGMKGVVPGRSYTFGLALHGQGRKGAEHWVSLPMTFSLDGDDTDFLAE
jgi:hypothetical protein